MSTNADSQNDDYARQLLACYDARHRSLVKIYTIFIASGFGFLAFILVPLMALKLDVERLPHELAMQEQILRSLQPGHDQLQKKSSGLKNELTILNRELSAFDLQQAETERQAIATRKEVVTVKARLDETISDISRAKIILAATRKYLKSKKYPNLESAIKKVYDKTLEEVKGLDVKISTLSVQEGKLGKNLESAENELRRIEAQQKQLAIQAAPLRKQVNDLETRVKVLSEELISTRKELVRGKEAVAQIEQRQVDIRNRLKNFQSPFGTLPLSLTEASLAFPFVVALGFVIYAMLIADLLRLRHEYHRIASASRTLDENTVRQRLGLVLPLWLDPLKTAWGNAGGVALVFLPALAYFVMVGLVSAGRFFELEAIRLDRHLISFYSVLYVAGAFFVALGVWRILSGWKAYRSMLATEPPDSQPKGNLHDA